MFRMYKSVSCSFKAPLKALGGILDKPRVHSNYKECFLDTFEVPWYMHSFIQVASVHVGNLFGQIP